MLHLYPSADNADQRHVTCDSIDAQAEREAAAIERLDEMLDQCHHQRPRYRVLAAAALEAAERGLPPVKHQRYPLAASLRAHKRLEDAFKGGRIPHVRFDPEITTPADRERRAARRRERAAMLQRLEQLPHPLVLRHEVRQLVGASDTSIGRAIRSGELRVHRDGKVQLVPVQDLQTYLRRRVG